MRVQPPTRIGGLFAAVATPVHDDGRVDWQTFDRLVEFLLLSGVDGICIGGATSEYPHFETEDRKALIRRAGAHAERPTLLVGIGAPSRRLLLELGAAALDAGSRALLLPMPMFFRYSQDDLQAFCADISRTLRAPCLLYDLPDFTNGLAPSTSLALLRDEDFICGIKDSSGREENLETFASARGDQPWTLLAGDDRLLQAAMRSGWDGAISGLAGFCPELLVALRRSILQGDRAEASRLQTLVDDLISHLGRFPTPWGIRIGLEARGISTGPLPLPLTDSRRREIQRFQEWFLEWLPATGVTSSFTAGGAGRR